MQAVPRKGAYAPFSAALYAQQTAAALSKKHYFLTVSKKPGRNAALHPEFPEKFVGAKSGAVIDRPGSLYSRGCVPRCARQICSSTSLASWYAMSAL